MGTEEVCAKDKMKGDNSKQMPCSEKQNRCIRTWAKKDDETLVVNQCGTEADCKTLKDACDKTKEGKCAVGCCDKDLCNAGPPVSFSLFLTAVCSALGLALLK